MIDPRASLTQSAQEQVFRVIFGEADEAILYKHDARQMRKVLRKHTTTLTEIIDADKPPTPDNLRMLVDRDTYAIGLDSVPFAVGWEGLSGDFDREVLRQWLEQNGVYAELIGQGFEEAFTAFEKHRTIQQEAAEKNS